MLNPLLPFWNLPFWIFPFRILPFCYLLFRNLPSPFRNLNPTSDFNDTGVRFEGCSLRQQFVGFRDLGRRCVNHKGIALYTKFRVSFPLLLDNKRPYSEEKRAILRHEWFRIFMDQQNLHGSVESCTKK